MWKQAWLWFLIGLAAGIGICKLRCETFCPCPETETGLDVRPGSGLAKFRWIRFVNHSGKTVKRVKVSRSLPTPAQTVFDYDSTIATNPPPAISPFQTTAGYWVETSKALATPLASTQKMKVEIWIDVGGASTQLAPVVVGKDELDSGASNKIFSEIVVTLDEDPAGTANHYQATLLGWHSVNDSDAFTITASIAEMQ